MSERNTEPSLRQLFEIGYKNAANIFHKLGEVTPIWHAVPEYGEHLLIATPWTNDDEKGAAIEALRDMFKEKNVVRFVMVVEAWLVTGPSALSGRPSKHPDRREVVRIQAEDRDGSMLSGSYYILRPEHGPATLSPFHEDPPEMSFGGRMSGLLAETRH